MITATRTLLACLLTLALSEGGTAQEIKPIASQPAGSRSCQTCGPQSGPRGCRWAESCFPRTGCCDDYCPNPLPRQCAPCYPSFYKCIPASDGGCCCAQKKDKLSCWFLPMPRALKEALWMQP
jgi:hypothetical protein